VVPEMDGPTTPDHTALEEFVEGLYPVVEARPSPVSTTCRVGKNTQYDDPFKAGGQDFSVESISSEVNWSILRAPVRSLVPISMMTSSDFPGPRRYIVQISYFRATFPIQLHVVIRGW
jgi:hypothetical protein